MRTFWFVLFEFQMLLITGVLLVGWLGLRTHMRKIEQGIMGLTQALTKARPGA
jgi:hypothetical protein